MNIRLRVFWSKLIWPKGIWSTHKAWKETCRSVNCWQNDCHWCVGQRLHRPKAASAKGCIGQRLHQPKAASAKGCIGQRLHRPKAVSVKGCISVSGCVRKMLRRSNGFRSNHAALNILLEQLVCLYNFAVFALKILMPNITNEFNRFCACKSCKFTDSNDSSHLPTLREFVISS
jgi:hypothetical protein